MEMNEHIEGIEHSSIQMPTIFWTDDSVFRGDYADEIWHLWKVTYLRWNKHCKIKRILDASGKRFVIDRFEEVPPGSQFAAFFRKKHWLTWVKPIIVSEKQLSLDEFKKEVLRAVKARYRHDLDSMIVEQTMEKLPGAKTYLEAIESLPKLL
jgi:hypothetical protein